MDLHKLQLRERERRDHHNHNHNHNHNTKPERLPPPPPPPSSTTSPSHDFSFTISLIASPPPPPPPPLSTAAATAASLDLAPADDIFLHGHLLPLQYSLPFTHTAATTTATTITTATTTTTTTTTTHNNNVDAVDNKEKPAKPKSLSSLFGLGKPKKPGEEEADKSKKDRKHKVFDVGRLLRKCMVEPIRVFMSGDKDLRRDLRRGQRPHSFSGHLNPRDKDQYSWRKKRRPGRQLSAPASMRTSPTNSGRLSATSLNMSSSDDSTMEELQSAIQAAIAHCKNSIAAATK